MTSGQTGVIWGQPGIKWDWWGLRTRDLGSYLQHDPSYRSDLVQSLYNSTAQCATWLFPYNTYKYPVVWSAKDSPLTSGEQFFYQVNYKFNHFRLACGYFRWKRPSLDYLKRVLKFLRLESTSYSTLSTFFLYSSMTHNLANDIILANSSALGVCLENAFWLLANIFAIKAFLVVKNGQKVSKGHREQHI